MSIIKYATRYLTYSLIALLVIFGVGGLIHSQYSSEEPASVGGSDTDAPPSPFHS